MASSRISDLFLSLSGYISLTWLGSNPVKAESIYKNGNFPPNIYETILCRGNINFIYFFTTQALFSFD